MSSARLGAKLATDMTCVSMPITPSPLPSAAAALTRGSAVAPRVRNTTSRTMNAAMKPSSCGEIPPVEASTPVKASPVNSTSRVLLRASFRVS